MRMNPGASPSERLHVHQAVFKNRLDDARAAVRDTAQRHKLRLKIRWEAGIFGGLEGDGARPAAHLHADPVPARADFSARFAEFLKRCIEQARLNMPKHNSPPRCCRCT